MLVDLKGSGDHPRAYGKVERNLGEHDDVAGAHARWVDRAVEEPQYAERFARVERLIAPVREELVGGDDGNGRSQRVEGREMLRGGSGSIEVVDVRADRERRETRTRFAVHYEARTLTITQQPHIFIGQGSG